MSKYFPLVPAKARRWIRCVAVLAAVLSVVIAILVVVIQRKQAASSNALWKIVHESCVPDMQANQNPSPCVRVDLTESEAAGFAIFKDTVGNTQYLIIPTAKITGIESIAAWAPDATNYFAKAWVATELVDQRVRRTLPRTDFAVAINSISGRTQNQLHIHVDCIQPKVKSTLKQVGSAIGTGWHTLPVKLSGHEYRAIWLPDRTLGQRNPFRLLADSLADPVQEMSSHTLVLVGAERDGQEGFILLDGKAPSLAVSISSWVKVGFGSGEELEDHSCRIANGV